VVWKVRVALEEGAMGVWQVHMHGMVGGISAHAGQSAMADGNTMQENSSVAGQYCDFGWHSCIFVETLPSPGLVHAGSVVFVCVYVCVCADGGVRGLANRSMHSQACKARHNNCLQGGGATCCTRIASTASNLP